MGLIINQPAPITVSELLKQVEHLNIQHLPEATRKRNVYAGGPVSPERGFVLHSTQSGWLSSLKVSDQIMVTTSKDILTALGTDNAPENYLVTLGYSGWSKGQLEEELLHNSWLTIPADDELIFKVPADKLWETAAKRLGIDIWSISPEAGHA
jgi:putative transcriptional regulator